MDFWSGLYDSEIERIELDIQIKKESIENEFQDLQDLAQLVLKLFYYSNASGFILFILILIINFISQKKASFQNGA